MPETLRTWARVLVIVGLVAGAGAFAAYATGDELYLGGEVVRTQMDAVWVLGVLGAALVAAAFVLVLRISEIGSQEEQQPSDR